MRSGGDQQSSEQLKSTFRGCSFTHNGTTHGGVSTRRNLLMLDWLYSLIIET